MLSRSSKTTGCLMRLVSVNLVLKCTSREVLMTEMIIKFSRRAHSYMLTYKALDIVGEEGREKGMGDEVDTSLDITYKQIENMQKIIKSHRAALNFDRGFIASTLKLAKNLDLKEAIEIGHIKRRGDGNGNISRTFN